MPESADRIALKIAALEHGAIWIRVAATIWGGWTVITLGYLGTVRPAHSYAPEGWPIYLGGAALSLLFLIAVAWRPWRDVAEWIDRVSTLLQWQVAAGVLIAFTIAIGARAELLIPFATYGAYLFLFAGTAMALEIVQGSLRRRYSELAEATERVRRAEEMRALLLAIREGARPGRRRLGVRRWLGF